jgi:ABC-type nickel/cobalt efflux system permease component RcnA
VFSTLSLFFFGIIHAIDPSHNKAALWGSVMIHHDKKKQVFTSAILFSLANILSLSIFSLTVGYLKNNFLNPLYYEKILHIGTALIMILLGIWFIWNGKKHIEHNHHHEEDNNYKIAFISGLIPCVTSITAMLNFGLGNSIQKTIFGILQYGIGIAITTVIILFIISILGEKILHHKLFKKWEKKSHFYIGCIIIISGFLNFL